MIGFDTFIVWALRVCPAIPIVRCYPALPYVCMVFGVFSRTKARSATNEVPKCRSPERALLRQSIIGVRFLTSARRTKLPK